ncbi:LysR family transcriptional regulator [Litoreibacter ponti]|uniref:LysR family transcriptional regulator n=1 Tax=Litoreibacter ponti TaxID=1510457 RepID=A0A2T6BIW4_9RHOB|nr:LysR family transcriptional regulator [Litoreibacter ponti]PTX55999.1 LysR family transcriptional regulator [Litoreibacter ponti]
MDTAALSLLNDVARQGSFAEAARLLDRDPSAVSRAVADVEARVGIRIFHRSTRRLSLTEEGARYLARITPLIEALEDATEEARTAAGTPQGHVRLTCSVAYGVECLVPLLDDFRARYPDISLEMDLSDTPRDLIQGRFDLALRLAPAPKGDLISRKLSRTRYHVCVSPSWLEHNKAPGHPNELAGTSCLLQSLPDYRSQWRFRDRSGKVHDVPVQGALTLSSPLALRSAAQRGLGPALLADWLVKDQMKIGQLVALLDAYDVSATTFETGVWALYPSRSLMPRKARVLLDFLAERLGN